jgi:hypothetical protein
LVGGCKRKSAYGALLWELGSLVFNICKICNVSLSGDFMALLLMHPYFENSAEEFHPHETLSAPMKFLSSLFINTMPHQPI